MVLVRSLAALAYKSRKFRAHRDAKLEIGYSLRSPPEIRRGSAAQRHGGGLKSDGNHHSRASCRV